jgi:hypothetical protein
MRRPLNLTRTVRSAIPWPTILSVICLLIESQELYSQTPNEIWNNPGTSNWFTPANWTPTGVPGSAQTAVVNTGIAQIMGGNATVNNLAISVPFGELPAGAGTVEVGAGNSLVVNNSLSIGQNGLLQIDDGGAFRVFGSIVNNGNIIFNSGSFFGVFAGTGSITKIGPGTLEEDASLDPAAHVFVNNGTLIDASASPGIIVVTGPTSVLRVNGGITLGITPTVSNGGTVDNFGLITAGVNYGPSGGNLVNERGGQIFGNINLGNGANIAQLFIGSKIAGSLNLGPNAGSTLILDGAGTQNLSQAVTEAITNAGSLVKQGSGTWTIDRALSAPVSTRVLAGVLAVNQTLTSPTVTVQSGAELTGPGTIVGDLFNFGLLHPGDAPGTLRINGNFTQASSGILNIELASPNNFDRLIVSGRATLDGTLRLFLLNGFKPTSGQFTIINAGQGIFGKFATVISPSGDPFQITYTNGLVTVLPVPVPVKKQPQLGDGTPISTTALLANSTFYGFGTPADRTFAAGKNNVIGISFDASEFDIKGQKGETYTFPITGAFKISDRVRLDYVIPLQYVKLPDVELFQGGLTVDVPINVIVSSAEQPWSWDITPTLAFAEAGSKEWIGGGALTNLLCYRCKNVTLAYGNYLSFFEGHRWTFDDVNFDKRVSQQIMKNGLKVTVQFGDWIFDAYGIYTQYFQSAAISSYFTIGGEVGRHFIWSYKGIPVDLGFISLGFYTEQGNRFSSGHVQFGSAWRF